MKTTLVRVSAVACAMSAVLLHVGRDRWFQLEPVHAQTLLHVRSPEALRRIALEFDAVAADVYWIRAIQHYGGERLAPSGVSRNYERLYPLLDMTTSLDPYFNIAYRFGAIFLSEPYPGGPGRPDLAIALLRKGIAAQPTRWTYYHDIGLVHYWALQDPQRCRDLVPSSRGCSGGAELAAAGRCGDADRNQRPHRGAILVAADSGVR